MCRCERKTYKTNIFVAKPLFWITYAHLLGIDDIKLFIVSSVIRSQAILRAWNRSALFLQFSQFIFIFTISHKFSIALRSGGWAGQLSKIDLRTFSKQFYFTLIVFENCREEVAERNFFSYFVLFGMSESACPNDINLKFYNKHNFLRYNILIRRLLRSKYFQSYIQ